MRPGPGLIVALDVADLADAERWVERLAPRVERFKVGLELFSRGGPSAVARLADRGAELFLDLKLHDIPRTVARSVEAVAALPGVRMLTVHAQGGHVMLGAAAEAAPPGLEILAVTVLTSLDAADLSMGPHPVDPAAAVMALAQRAVDAGVHGLVASGEEAARLRAALGASVTLVVPGIRPAGAEIGDQKRVVTPRQAAEAGADWLVVGRPVLEAQDPEGALDRILAELPGDRRR